MNIAVINAEVVFKPIKTTIASDPGRRKVVYDICGDYTRNLVKLVHRAFQSRQRALKKLLFLNKKKGEDRTAARTKKGGREGGRQDFCISTLSKTKSLPPTKIRNQFFFKKISKYECGSLERHEQAKNK